jgi:exopolyphosphatase / guanosine-5'-triphosphate,3'-diphosphate pyrophosphatase
MPAIHEKKPSTVKRLAVVDIGSNSVRLVIYRCANGKAEIIKDKKAICRLAFGMHHKHPELNLRGMKLTLQALKQFKSAIEKSGASKVLAIATAALRATAFTDQGRDFHRRAERALGHKIKIISGRKEARLTALGVISNLRDPAGLCGDLGGGSLELASVHRGRVGHTATVALGTLTLLSETHGDPLVTEKLVDQRIQKIAWLKRVKGETFYAIGGSWRAVGRIIMHELGMAPRTIHGFTIKAERAKSLAAAIARRNPADFHKMSKKISQRADIIPMAAATLTQLIASVKPHQIVFSGRGVREGLVKQYLEKI